MDGFWEQFINGVYQETQQTLSYLFGYPSYRCTVIKFGGFCYSQIDTEKLIWLMIK